MTKNDCSTGMSGEVRTVRFEADIFYRRPGKAEIAAGGIMHVHFVTPQRRVKRAVTKEDTIGFGIQPNATATADRNWIAPCFSGIGGTQNAPESSLALFAINAE